MSDLAVQILVYVLAAGGAGLFVWGWFGDWWLGKRGKRALRRCPKCWYDLTHTVGMVCSECGFEGKNEKRFGKARRRKRWCVLAVLLLVSGSVVGGAYPGFSARGWVVLVPDWVLIMGMPALEDRATLNNNIGYLGTTATNSRQFFFGAPTIAPGSSYGSPPTLSGEFWYRVNKRMFSKWEWRWIAERAFAGDAGRPPTCAAWEDFYGRLLYAAVAAEAVEQERVTAFAEGQWRIDIRVPERWPVGMRYPVYVYREFWRPFSSGSAGGGGGLTREQGRARFPIENHYWWLGNKPVSGGPQVRFCELPVEPGPADFYLWEYQASKGQDSLARTFEIPIPQPAPAAIEELLTPVQSPELSALLVERVSAELRGADRMPPGVFPGVEVNFELLEGYFRAEEVPTIGVVVEVMRDGEVEFSGRGWVWMRDTSPLSSTAARVLANLRIHVPLPTVWLSLLNQEERYAKFTNGEWTVRLRSDAELALLNLDCDEYWVGEVVIPLTVGQ